MNAQGFGSMIWQLSHEKNSPTFHYTGWVYRDPYNGLSESLYKWVI